MSTPELLAQLLFEAMNSRDLTRLEAFLAPDAVFDFPGAGALEGPRSILAFLKILFRKYSRLVFTIHDTIVQDDRSSIIWTNEGITASGKPYANRGVTVLQVTRDGMIGSISDYFKDTSFTKEAR